MELKKVLIGLEGLKAKGSLDIEINNLDSNSKNIKDGDIFHKNNIYNSFYENAELVINFCACILKCSA